MRRQNAERQRNVYALFGHDQGCDKQLPESVDNPPAEHDRQDLLESRAPRHHHITPEHRQHGGQKRYDKIADKGLQRMHDGHHVARLRCNWLPARLDSSPSGRISQNIVHHYFLDQPYAQKD